MDFFWADVKLDVRVEENVAASVRHADVRLLGGEQRGELRLSREGAEALLEALQASLEAPKLDAVRRIVFLHGKANQGSVVYGEAVEELARLGLDPS